ncbi:acetyl-coenzyme A transporter 1-like protein [Sarcoptes scabiei]|uniref:Acetyl-coenzyme A transporter 1-like protein n=1 Tax=Sarcoptes scabiei TaxID=52283 RepID=A0A132AJA2_SARSC|nr:acetyl-coenzyme A transporter 1-like protein [Sarcoptes scabiei]
MNKEKKQNLRIRNQEIHHNEKSDKISNFDIDPGNSLRKDLLDLHLSNCLPSDLKEDYLNIFILLLLYMLQGIPLGLISGVPYLLTNRGISYSEQAIFSFAIWPFSFKLLWAPIVDSVYYTRFGKRKSWMIPSQYLIGLFMIFISYYLDSMMNSVEGFNIYLLTGMFLFLNFLAATQDIAVDGWALTMLKPCNVGYASTCNTVGQTAGYFFGYVVFLILESSQFANYFRTEPLPYGFVNLHDFFFFWGVVFLIVTTLIMIFKKETSSHDRDHHEDGIVKTYCKLIEILKLPPVQYFAIVLLTCKISFAITDAATGLKLKEAGLPMDHIAFLALPILPLQIILPWIIGHYTNGPRPLDVFIKAYPYRLIFGYVFCIVLWWTRHLYWQYQYFPFYYYFVLIIVYAMQQITVYSMYVALMSFHAKISDPKIGGTYMTLLNTITNLGGNWPATLALWLLDYLNFSYCSLDGSPCRMAKTGQLDQCGTKNGGKCEIYLDGYYIETMILSIFGTLWYFWGRKQIHYLQNQSLRVWRCKS